MEKEASYTTKNTYSTLNEITDKTKTVWIVFHGLGYLSRYFVKHFSCLQADENYIIAPQAQAKQYLNGKFTHVGSCWLTKENTDFEMQNIMNYIDALLESENIPNHLNINVLGFSQGVSIATRYLAKRDLKCNHLILYAGKTPREFTQESFKNVEKVTCLIGNKDQYITDKIVTSEKEYLKSLFTNNLTFRVFNGKHEVMTDEILKL